MEHSFNGKTFTACVRMNKDKAAGAQTERRGDAGLVRSLLGGKGLTGRFYLLVPGSLPPAQLPYLLVRILRRNRAIRIKFPRPVPGMPAGPELDGSAFFHNRW